MTKRYPGPVHYLDWARANIFQTAIDLRMSGAAPRSPESVSIDWRAVKDTLCGTAPYAVEGLVADRVAERYSVGSDQVTMGGGTNGINFHVIAGLVPPDGEVLVERPVYEPLWSVPRLLGRAVRFVDRPRTDGYRINPSRVEAALSHETRLVVLSRLHNPTGVDISTADLEALGVMAQAHDLWVLVDEVYVDFLPSSVPAASVHPRLLSTNSLTKVYGLPWLRAGWCLGSVEASKAVQQARDRAEVLWGAPDRAVALALWERLDVFQAEAIALAEGGRKIAEAIVAQSEHASMVSPPGGLVGFVWWGGDDIELTKRLEARGVGVTPGQLFEAPGGVRVGWGGDPQALETGLCALMEEIEADCA